MIYYHGSQTEPPCSETVTWIVNIQPHVITPNQVNDLNALLSPEVRLAGGNNRNITGSNEQHDGLTPSQRVWKFSQTGMLDVPP